MARNKHTAVATRHTVSPYTVQPTGKKRGEKKKSLNTIKEKVMVIIIIQTIKNSHDAPGLSRNKYCSARSVQ